MLRIRVIPCLLLRNNKLVKTIQFKKSVYIGDPINAIKIFNEKEVDELICVDIGASVNQTPIAFDLLEQLSSECFMPLAYGGGVKSIENIRQILRLGAEKVIINTAAHNQIDLIKQAAEIFGSQSIIAAIDVKKMFFGSYAPFLRGGKKRSKYALLDFVKTVEEMGAGEIFLNSIDHDGMMNGYDYKLIDMVTKSVSIPVIACGGAGKLEDFSDAVKNGANAVAAGSLFVFQGKHKAVLINYPSQNELKELFD